MLSVRIDGREVETTPVSLARLVFDGRADRHSPSKSPGSTAERSLEQSLDSPHGEALCDELLRRLQAMYGSQQLQIDLQDLCTRVERLCRWRWADSHVAARFLWAAAWLNDILDRPENAAEFYDAFLQTSSSETHLRLLAYNNRGILRIRLGRLEGVLDMMRAAVPASKAKADSPSEGLPAACFNLLNLINVSLESEPLARVVDGELVEYFSRLPDDRRTLWLGEGVTGRNDQWGEEESGTSPSILYDPTYKRLNMLTSRLAARARLLAGGEFSAMTDKLSAGASQLILWESRLNGDSASGNGHLTDGEYGFCAEAASLLLSEDIPSMLTRLESPLARAEQAVREELASIESSMTLSGYELAKSRLEVQREILCSLDRRGRLAGLLARVDAQLERIVVLQSQSEQLGLQKTCAELVSDVERFCRHIDLCRAEREHGDLMGRLRDARSRLSPRSGAQVSTFLDDLAVRLDRHLQRLKRLETRKGIRDPMRYLRQNWPEDWAAPVPEAIYQALAQCHLSDPQCRVEDWAALKDRLDGHQGQHHLHRALATLQAEQASWGSVTEDLVEALVCKPDLWLAVAPLFGLFLASNGTDSPEATVSIQMAMRAAAGRLFDGTLQDAGSDEPMHHASELLERVFSRMEGRADRCLELWRCVAATLSPILDGDNLEEIAKAKGLAERCLDGWPAGTAQLPGRVDPRNPVHLFLEFCDKARRLVEVQQWLNARPPQWDRAATGYGELLDLGLDTRDQLRRAVTGYYLAAYHEKDASYVQRQVLTGLEAWVDRVTQERIGLIRRQEVAREVAGLRAAVPIEWSQSSSEPIASAGDEGPNDSTGGGQDPQEEGKSDA